MFVVTFKSRVIVRVMFHCCKCAYDTLISCMISSFGFCSVVN